VGALALHRRKRYDGQVALATLAGFSLSTAVIECFRADYGASPYWGPLPQLLWTAIAMSVVSVAALARAEAVHRRRAAPAMATVP
jgi:hypothetical protein